MLTALKPGFLQSQNWIDLEVEQAVRASGLEKDNKACATARLLAPVPGQRGTVPAVARIETVLHRVSLCHCYKSLSRLGR